MTAIFAVCALNFRESGQVEDKKKSPILSLAEIQELKAMSLRSDTEETLLCSSLIELSLVFFIDLT